MDYDVLQVGNEIYQCYHVAKKGIGAWYCVYKNGTLIAEMKKSMQLTNEMTDYKLYMADDANRDMLCMITGIFHCKNYENYKITSDSDGNTDMLQDRNSIPNHLREEMLQKYDPEFPSRVS